MVPGVVLCALAGGFKEKELRGDVATGSAPAVSTPFALGLLFCIISSVFSALLNFGLIFGEPIASAAVRAGASEVAKNNAIWALVFTANYLVNTVYAFWKMFRNKTFSQIRRGGSLGHWGWAFFMGIAWPMGVVLFGIGAGKMGRYGAFVAFPMLLVMAILFGNLAGALTGEWRGTSTRTRITMIGGVVILFAAFVVFGLANLLLEG